MKEIVLSGGVYKALVDDNMYDEINQYSWRVQRGCNTIYARTDVNGKPLLMHRLVMKIAERDLVCDHVDEDGLNNQTTNLRFLTYAKNNIRSGPRKANKSGYKGVHPCGKSWRAVIHIDRKTIALGRYATKEEAAEAYNKAAVSYFGELCYLNPIPKSTAPVDNPAAPPINIEKA